MKRILLRIGGLSLGCLAGTAHAFPAVNPCTYLGGCGTAGGVVAFVNTAIVSIATFLAVGGGALAVIYTVVGGLQMVLSAGDDGKFTRGRTSVQWALIGFGILLGSQMIVNFIAAQASLAAGAPAPILELMRVVVGTILGLLNVIFLIIIMISGVRAIIGRGKQEEYTTAKHAVGYALAGAIVINLARALAYAVFNILG